MYDCILKTVICMIALDQDNTFTKKRENLHVHKKNEEKTGENEEKDRKRDRIHSICRS